MAINSLRALPADRFDYWHAQHLLNRAGFGGTPGQVRGLTKLGLDGAVDYILDYGEVDAAPVEADRFDRNLMRPYTEADRQALRRARMQGDEAAVEAFRRERQRRQAADRRQVQDVRRWWLRRMIETPRPLQEKMTLFWHGHFATGYRAIEDSYHMFLQNQLFRAYATGNFKALTQQVIRDPAMLRYLNNDQNRKQRPNENLARELMELFTLGEGNGYSEQDIKEGARALTGYTFDDDEFEFDRRAHDPGTKRIFGRSGNFDGDDFVELIFEQRYASEYLTWKLYRFFVNDLPGVPDENAQGFILKLARKFRDSGYELKPVLRTLFRSEHFYDETNVASQIKSPVQLVVQALRSLRPPARDLGVLLDATDRMGQSLLNPPSVKGWDGGRVWINTSTLFVRQNVMVYLITGRRPDRYEWQTTEQPFDFMHLVEHLRDGDGRVEPRRAASYLLRFNLGAEPQEERVAEIVRFIDGCGGRLTRDVLVGVLSLITAMPEYQLC